MLLCEHIDTNTYKLRAFLREKTFVDGHGCHTSLNFGVNAKENQDNVPTLNWLPKLHKNPIKARLIANSISRTTTELSKVLTYKHHYDKSTRQRMLRKGDKVLLHLPTSRSKLMLQWKSPYKVVEVVNRMNYGVTFDDMVGTYHNNLLKRFEEMDDTVLSCMAIMEAEPS